MTRRDGAGEIEARLRDSPASSVRAPRSRDSKSASQRSWRSNPLRSTMRGARRLGALFLFVASLVAALKSDELINSGFTATTDRDGNPVYVKMMMGNIFDGEVRAGNIFDSSSRNIFDSADVTDRLDNIEFARQWLSMVTSVGHTEITVGKGKLTPLHIASLHGLVDEARALLELDADIDATDIKERTALHHAAMMDRLDVVELLLEWDADLYAKDQKYSSPQDAAADLVAQDEGDVGVAASLRSGTYPDRARAAGARRGARGKEGRRGRWVATRARTHRVGRPQRRRGREDDRQHRLVLLSKVLVKIKRD